MERGASWPKAVAVAVINPSTALQQTSIEGRLDGCAGVVQTPG
jgi:hypothetical protein